MYKYSLIFKTFDNDLNGTLNKIGIFQHSFQEIKDEFKLNGMSGVGSLFFGKISDSDIDKIKQYNQYVTDYRNGLPSGVSAQTAWNRTMLDTSKSAQRLVESANGAAVSTDALTVAQRISTFAAKAQSVALKAASIAANMIVFTLAIKGIQALTTWIKNLNNDNEKLEKRISSLKDKYSDYSSQLNDINSKLEENKKRIQEILALNTPTYVDEKELSKLREENSLLERNAELTQKAKDATAQKAVDTLEKQFNREFVTNDAKHEDAIKIESIEDYAKNIFTFGMYNASQSAKIRDEDSELEKFKAHINELEGLIKLRDKILSQDSDFSAYEHLSDINNEIDEYEKASKLGRLDHKDAKLLQELKEEKENMLSEGIVDLSDFGDFTNIEEINAHIASLTDNLSSYNSELMTTLNDVSEYDPNYESSFAQQLIRYIDEIYKHTNPDEWIQSTVDKIYNTERFSDITKAINEKLSNGEEIKYEDLLSDDSYKNLVKAISLSLYNSADDDSIAKAASYVAQKVASLITNNEVVVHISLDEAIGKLAKDDKEKLLQLATAGELSADTLSSTDEYKKLSLETGLFAEELLDAIQKLNVATKTKDVDDLSTVLTKVQNGASFSATEIADLVSKNEDLSKAVKITADGYSLEEDAVLSLLNSNISLYNTSVANEINRTQTQIEATKTRIKALKEEMDVINKVASATIKASTSPILAQNGFFGSVFGGVANDMGNALNDSAQKQIDESEKELNSLYTHLDQLFKDPFKQEKESSSKSEKDSSSVFDWIETRISRIQRSFEKMVDSVTKYVSTHFKFTTITSEMNKIDEQISAYQQAAQRYEKEADDVSRSLSSDLKNKVINGTIDISTISDEKTSKAVNDFKTWYEKYLDAIDNVITLQNTKRDKLREKLDVRLFGIQTNRERISVKADTWQDRMDYKESLGKSVYSSDYRWMINNATQQYSNIESENTILNDYLSTLDKTSEEWADIQSKIESNESSMRDLIASQVEWNNKIAQMPIDKAEKTIDKLATKREYINAKYDNSTSSFNQREMNQNLAKNLKNELSAYRESYNTTGKNFSTAKYNINQLQANSSIISKVQRYTKSGKDIPADVLSSVYSSGNVRLINRVNQYIATLTAKQTAYDTYKLNKELTKSELSEIGQKNLETISNAYANKYTTIDNKKSYLNAQKENTEASGKYVTSTYYNQMIAQTAKELNAKMEESKKLQSIIDKNVKDGLWTKSSQAYKDAVSEVEKLKTEIVELTTEQKNYNKELNQLPIDKIQTALDILDKLSSRDTSKNSLKKAQGNNLSVSDYQKELSNYQKQIDKMLELRDKYWGRYWDAKSKGKTADADKYLQQYYEEDIAINNLKTSYEELQNTMRDDVYWRSLERMHTVAVNLKNTLSSLSDLFNDDMMFDDNGNFTDIAIAKIGTLVKQYETAQKEIQNYTNDIKNLNKLYSQGMYTEDEYKDKLAELQIGLMDATKDVKSFTDSIVEMYISQKEAELDALNELIDKRKEALNAKKKYYDYDKTIKDKNRNIQSLQKEIAALEGISTAEAKAQLARAKSELQQAQEELEDTKFEHKIELIVNGFDALQTELQDNHDEYIKNLKSSFEKQIDIIESANSVYAQSYKKIISSMTKMLEYYGVDTSTIKVNELAGFAEGGVIKKKVHQNGDSALVSVNPEETILTSDFTKILPQAVNAMENFIKPQIPNYDKVLSNIRLRETPNVTMHYDTLMTVNGDMVDLNKATMDIVNHNMKTIAHGVSKDFKDQIGKITKQRWH